MNDDYVAYAVTAEDISSLDQPKLRFLNECSPDRVDIFSTSASNFSSMDQSIPRIVQEHLRSFFCSNLFGTENKWIVFACEDC